MTSRRPPEPRSPRLLLVSTVILATVGLTVLNIPQDQPSPDPAMPSVRQTIPGPSPRDTAPAAEPSAVLSTVPAASASWAAESALPPRGEGPAGDHVIQRNLETSWPADLPATDERELLRAGRALLRADVTGHGRERWPAVFPGSSAPAFATAGFRIQAVIARRDGGPGRAVVHLVWAGTDHSGVHLDGRVTDLYFTRTLKGAAPWAPHPST